MRVTGSVPHVRVDVAPAACEAYVRARPDATPYHLPAWMGVIERAFGHESTYLTAQVGDQIVGVLPLVFFNSRLFGRFAVSVPFVNYGGVLADGPDAEQALLAHAIEDTTRAGGAHLELRHASQRFPALASRHHKVAMVLPLAGTVDQQWNQLDRKVRNQIRKGEKSQLTAVVGGAELLPEFYAVFSRNMRDLGTPVYSSRFFEEVCRTFPDQARVFIVRTNGQPAAASIVHWLGTTLQVPWASALREFNALSANVFLYWQMVKHAVEQGFVAFDFGRSTPNEGTFHFKKQWGAEPVPLVWEYWTAPGVNLPNLSPTNPKFDLAIRVWQRLPLALTTMVGPSIVRNIP